jgi:hypothetical protein
MRDADVNPDLYGESKLPVEFDKYIDADIEKYGFTFTMEHHDGKFYPHTNVEHLCSLHERADFHWGYLGPACMNLALNILEMVMEENPDWRNDRPIEVAYGTCDEVTFYLYSKFCKEMLSDLPAFKSCYISYYEVERWLVKNMAL